MIPQGLGVYHPKDLFLATASSAEVELLLPCLRPFAAFIGCVFQADRPSGVPRPTEVFAR